MVSRQVNSLFKTSDIKFEVAFPGIICGMLCKTSTVLTYFLLCATFLVLRWVEQQLSLQHIKNICSLEGNNHKALMLLMCLCFFHMLLVHPNAVVDIVQSIVAVSNL